MPIDQCFRLVGLIRMHWKGFTGGAAVWEEIDRFFADLASVARPARQASVPDLSFQVEGAEVTPYAMVPLLTFRLRAINAPADEAIHNVVLRCQIQIEATRRHYSRGGGDPTPRPVRRARALGPDAAGHALDPRERVVPPFSGETVAELPVACTYDFNVAATKYFYALEDGEIPLDFLFSGSVFYQRRRGRASGRADLLGPGGALPPAGEHLAAV